MESSTKFQKNSSNDNKELKKNSLASKIKINDGDQKLINQILNDSK